jgi:hypothetical protein
MMHVAAQLRVTAPPTSATGTAWERTPWRAIQRAAWLRLPKPTWQATWEGQNDGQASARDRVGPLYDRLQQRLLPGQATETAT